MGGINKAMDHSIYLHMPFCKRRCHYCDFNTYAGKEHFISPYIDALLSEIRVVNESKKSHTIHSVYFGGGTPSLIPLLGYREILFELKNLFTFTSDCEISIEANPGTLSLEYLTGLLNLGINRISLGIQSTNTFDLVRLDRIHDIQDILMSVKNARTAGFTNINLDLIFGLPWQDLQSWKNSLSRALELNPSHFSLYSLIIEPGTMLHQWYQRGLIAKQDQDLEAEMYELAMEMLEKYGFEQYEISNWAKSSAKADSRCRHNLQYWQNHPYFGFGAGAHGYVAGNRTENVSTINEYIQSFTGKRNENYPFATSPATISRTLVDIDTQMKDFMMLGLRLVKDGVSEDRFRADFGLSMKAVFSEEITTLVNNHLLEWVDVDHNRLRLSKKGILLGNQVFVAFV